MKNFLLTAVSALLVFGAIGCGGHDTPYVPINTGGGTKPTPDFSVSVQQVTPTQTITEESEETANSTNRVHPFGEFEGATFQVTVTPLNGFSGTVTLSATNDQGSSEFGLDFSPTNVNVSGGTTSTSTFEVSLNGTVPLKTYSFAVTGASGSLSHTATTHPLVSVVGPPPDFSISLSPSGVEDLNLPANAVKTRGFDFNGSWTVTVTALNGFTGTVKLAATNPNTQGFTTSFGSSSLVLSSSKTSATTTFTAHLVGVGTEDIGQSQFLITGTSGSLSHEFNATLDVTQSSDD